MSVKKGLGLVLGTAVISGVSIFLNAWGVKGFDSSVFTFGKNLVVAVLLTSLILATTMRKQLTLLTKKQWLSLAGIGLVGGSIPFLLFFHGLSLTSGTAGAFIHKSLFLWIGIIALFTIREKIPKLALLGGLAVLVGNAFFLRVDIALVSTAHLFILGATLLWATENVWAKHLVNDLSGTVIAWARMTFGAGFIFVYLLITGKAPIVWSMSAAQYAWIGITATLLLAYVLTYYNGIAHINVTTAAAILTLGSPITTVLSWMFLDGSISLMQASGMVLILAGCASMIWFSELRFTIPSPAGEKA